MQKVITMLAAIIAPLISLLKKPDSTVGIKESKELLIGVNELSIILIAKFRDGVQFSDFTELYSDLTEDLDVQEAMKKAYDGVKGIPAELKDIDAGEGLELAQVQLEYLPKIINV